MIAVERVVNKFATESRIAWRYISQSIAITAQEPVFRDIAKFSGIGSVSLIASRFPEGSQLIVPGIVVAGAYWVKALYRSLQPPADPSLIVIKRKIERLNP